MHCWTCVLDVFGITCVFLNFFVCYITKVATSSCGAGTGKADKVGVQAGESGLQQRCGQLEAALLQGLQQVGSHPSTPHCTDHAVLYDLRMHCIICPTAKRTVANLLFVIWVVLRTLSGIVYPLVGADYVDHQAI